MSVVINNPQNPLLGIYCDESRQTQHRFMAVGGLIIDEDAIEHFNDTMRKFRVELNMNRELKWTKVSTGKLSEYKRFVDYFFALSNTNHVAFHSMVIDTHQLDHARYNQGDKDLGLNKFYYLLLIHAFGKRYYKKYKPCRFIVLVDKRSSKQSLSEFRRILNNGFSKKYGAVDDPFRTVEPRDSKGCEMLQINDILLGAIGYHWNDCNLLSGASKAKISLSNYIAAKAGLPDLSRSTKYGARRFTIWKFKPSSK